MRTRAGIALAALAAALTVGSASGVAQAGSPGAQTHAADRSATKVYTLVPSTHGNPEGVAWDGRTQRFFVGAIGDGTIYRGRLGDQTVRPFIAGATGKVAVGLKVFHGKLYVAGGPTGRISVYSIRTGTLLASFDTGTGGFLNDLVVTPRGDVYVTDSFRPTLWQVTAAQVRAGTGKPEGIDVRPEIVYAAGAFNLNGIVDFRGGRELVVVNTANGRLFRIVFDKHAKSGRTITPIDAPALVGGDGMIVDRGRLVVVIGDPASLNFVKLNDRHTRGEVVAVRTDPTLRGPSTVARAADRYLVVNADFAASRTPFTVSSLPREAHD